MTDTATTTSSNGKITDDAVEQIRRLIGVEVPGIRNGNTLATRDAFVNYCRGMGDVNPLFRDDDHAARSRWRGMVAHPTFLRYMGEGLGQRGEIEPPPPDAPRRDPIAGVHGFFSGVDLEFFRPIEVGDELRIRGGLSDVQLKSSRMGGQAVHQTYDKVCWNQRGDLVGVARDLHIRIERDAARERGSNQRDDIPKSYTAEEIEEIDRAYEAEDIRGTDPRYWEDVNVGDESVPLVKGPYTVTSFIVFMAGTGLLRSRFFYTHAEAYAERKRHPKGFPLNPLGIPDSVAVVHWDKEMANRAGVPERYDAGAERIAWMSQAVTHWMGDDAFLRRLKVHVRGFFYVGDALWITCKVVGKSESDEGRSVSLEVSGRTQRGDVVASATADVLLPSRDQGPVRVPVVPAEPVSIFQRSPHV